MFCQLGMYGQMMTMVEYMHDLNMVTKPLLQTHFYLKVIGLPLLPQILILKIQRSIPVIKLDNIFISILYNYLKNFKYSENLKDAAPLVLCMSACG